jgi:hypothetical protein
MTLTMTMVTIAGLTYSPAAVAAKRNRNITYIQDTLDHNLQCKKCKAHIDVTKYYESYECILISYHHKCLYLCVEGIH